MIFELDKNDKLLIDEIRSYVEEAKTTVAITANSATTILYWNIGNRINKEILEDKRAEYGKQIISKISYELTNEYGKGWSEKHLRHCVRFAETFRDREIVYALSRQLTWTHFRTLIYIKDDLRRNFYLEMCKTENWTTRELNEKIDSMFFERTAISKKPEEQIKKELKLLSEENKLIFDLVFRDFYVFDFFGLYDYFSE